MYIKLTYIQEYQQMYAKLYIKGFSVGMLRFLSVVLANINVSWFETGFLFFVFNIVYIFIMARYTQEQRLQARTK